MRVICYLHLTRFVRMLLDRKDRMSMAVGLEVRVPFCDHRLVEYVYNTPWSLKTYDGREKSLLHLQVRELLAETALDNPVFEVINRDWLSTLVRSDPSAIDSLTRHALERSLDLAAWIDIHHPEIRTS